MDKYCDNEFTRPRSTVNYPRCWYTQERCCATKFESNINRYIVVHNTAKLCPRFEKVTK